MQEKTLDILRYFAAVDRACRRNRGLSRDERAHRQRLARAQDGHSRTMREFAKLHTPRTEQS